MKTKMIAALAMTLITANVFAAPYELDVAHTDVSFSVKHLMISTAKGSFRDFKGSFDFDEAKGTLKNIDVEIQMASVDTKQPKRDDHLKSPDFFDVAKYPTMTFKADSATVKEGKPVKLNGTLTMRGVSKPVTLDLVYAGRQTDPYGVAHSGFSLSGKINRKDFGLTWNAPVAKSALDKGGVAIGEEVTIDISGEIVPKKEDKK